MKCFDGTQIRHKWTCGVAVLSSNDAHSNFLEAKMSRAHSHFACTHNDNGKLAGHVPGTDQASGILVLRFTHVIKCVKKQGWFFYSQQLSPVLLFRARLWCHIAWHNLQSSIGKSRSAAPARYTKSRRSFARCHPLPCCTLLLLLLLLTSMYSPRLIRSCC